MYLGAKYKLIGFVIATIHKSNVYETRESTTHSVARMNSSDILLRSRLLETYYPVTGHWSLVTGHWSLVTVSFFDLYTENSPLSHMSLVSIHALWVIYLSSILILSDCLCGLVVRVLGYRSGGPGSIPDTTRKK
jgi:hypothetical protein